MLEKVFASLNSDEVELLVAGAQPVNSNLPNFRSLGFIKETEELYAAADFTLLASRYDAFGQVVSESLLCGTPVIVSHRTGAKTLVTPQNGIVVESLKVADWLTAIREAIARNFQIDPAHILRNGINLHDHMSVLLKCARI